MSQLFPNDALRWWLPSTFVSDGSVVVAVFFVFCPCVVGLAALVLGGVVGRTRWGSFALLRLVGLWPSF